ncbi:MAG: dTDP-4-amino-4,6-dideoxygalactose transaminase [Clostridia bacterium]|nr:dTDP-4-amino-4,6-dideoxygalactose transaminase [Clostridia bacterium]
MPFNIPPYIGAEDAYVLQAIQSHKICGDGEITKRCNAWLEKKTGTAKALLTTSCSHALDLSALLLDIQPGDEVIMPSFTFVSTANAFVLRGAKIVFVDIRPDTQNLDETLIEAAITEKTRAIAPVHYAGVPCEMDKIMEIAKKYNLYVVEDNAQGIMGTYKGRDLGTFGQLGCLSFHETKNYSMGEGGAILINDPSLIERAEILREKGTDRSRFLRGQVDKYTWTDLGSSFLPSELNAAYLLAQLEHADEINNSRMAAWNRYYEILSPLAADGKLELPVIPEGCTHNAHMFYVKVKGGIGERTDFIRHMKEQGAGCVFHYVPLHSSPAGLRFGRFAGEDRFTTDTADRLVRLPMHYGLTVEQVDRVCKGVYAFFA